LAEIAALRQKLAAAATRIQRIGGGAVVSRAITEP
jgi:hypothetical protein